MANTHFTKFCNLLQKIFLRIKSSYLTTWAFSVWTRSWNFTGTGFWIFLSSIHRQHYSWILKLNRQCLNKRLDTGDFCFCQQLKSQMVFSDFEKKLLSFIIWFENRLIRKKMRYAYHRVNFCFKGWLRLGHWVFWGCWGRVGNGGHCKLWDAHKWSTKPARRVWPRLRSLFKINQLWT